MTINRKQHELINVNNANTTLLSTHNQRAARLWDRVAPRYAAKPVPNQDVYNEKLAITREYLQPTAEVLEIGCGTGSTAIAHAPCVKSIKAIDVSSRMIDIAKEKAVAANVTNIDFVHVDVDCLQFGEERFDVVLMLNVLHLFKAWDQHIVSAYKALKPGGVLVSSTLCLRDDHAFIRIPAMVGRLIGLAPPLVFFTRVELEQAVANAGFELKLASKPERKSAVFLIAKKP